MKKIKDIQKFHDFLKEQGYPTSEIQYLISVADVGKTMTDAIYDFNFKYDNQLIDGFLDSSIEILELHYGEKRLKNMKEKTLFNKVYSLQKCLESNVDKENIIEAVKYYLKKLK